MNALKLLGLMAEIEGTPVPKDALLINTWWIYALKYDDLCYVTTFKERIVALRNYQRTEIDFYDTLYLCHEYLQFGL